MALKTNNFGLIKPQLTDPADITAFNENWDKIDEQLLKAGETGGSDLGKTEITDIEADAPELDPVTRNAIEKIFRVHTEDKQNPHSVTATQVGLGNVPNVSTNDQTPTYTTASTLSKLSSGEKLSTAFGKISKAINDLISHLSNKSNPHGVTASQVGALTSSDVVNNLTNTSTTKPLSANQGKVLKDMITNAANLVTTDVIKTNLNSTTDISQIETFTAPASGIYFIEGIVNYYFNTSGMRFGRISTQLGGMRVAPTPSGQTQMILQETVYLSGGQTVYMDVCQNSGSTLYVETRMRYSYIPL